MKKLIISTFILGFIFIVGCKTVKPIEDFKVIEKRTFWGNKGEIINFLNSTEAVSERWLIQAIGD